MAAADLRDAIREAASSRAWSQGVTLAREDRISGRSASKGEQVVEVRVPTRPTPYTVVLYFDDEEWDCDCGSREAACSHACAAAIVAAEAAAKGVALPVSKTAGAAIGYRLAPDPAGLALTRVAIEAGRETPITTSVQSSAAGRGPKLATTEADLLVDQLLGTRPDAPIGADRVDRLLQVLADVADVRFAGQPVKTSGEVVTPRAILSDAGDGVVVRLEAPTGARAVSLGVARIGDTLHPIGAIDLGGARFEHLPAEQRFRGRELGAVATTMVPALAARIPIEIRTRRLPSVARGMAPRVMLDVVQRGESLSIMAIVVYGDPPVARVDGDRLVHLGGDVPVRDLDGEQRLRHRLRSELDLLPGRRIEASGRDAFELSAKVARWLRADAAAADAARAVPLAFDVDVSRGLAVTVGGEGRAVDALAALRAWQAGADLVALEGGGWGRAADAVAGAPRRDPRRPPGRARARRQAAGVRAARRGAPGRRPGRAGADGSDAAARAGRRLRGDPRGAAPGGPDGDAAALPAQGRGLAVRSAATRRWAACWPTTWASARRSRPSARCEGARWWSARPCAQLGRRGGAVPSRLSKVALYHGAGASWSTTPDVTLTTYPICATTPTRWRRSAWDAVILDEAQAIKNPDSQVARAAYQLKWRVPRVAVRHAHREPPRGAVEPAALHQPRAARRARDFASATRRRSRPATARPPWRGCAAGCGRSCCAAQEGGGARAAAAHRGGAVLRARRARARGLRRGERGDAARRGGGLARARREHVMAALEALLRLRQAACHSGLVPGQRADSASSKVTCWSRRSGGPRRPTGTRPWCSRSGPRCSTASSRT
jgi:hypothetical protein